MERAIVYMSNTSKEFLYNSNTSLNNLTFGEYREGHVSDHIYAKDMKIGQGVVLESDIGTPQNPCEYVELGDNVYIGKNCNIQTPMLMVGDYTKIHRNCLIFGHNPLSIGHNSWFGENCILDCEGNLHIGDNVGVGAYSQLWSHIRHGDMMFGCKYLSFGRLVILDDAWLVGHCITSPVIIGACSMALVGSVITKDMNPNCIYGGSPAKDLTDKLGPPFNFTSPESRFDYMYKKLQTFIIEQGNIYTEMYGSVSLVPVFDWDDTLENTIQFNVVTREYTKTGQPVEVAFMKYLLPEAKFIPRQL